MGNGEYGLLRRVFAAALIVAACSSEDDPLRPLTLPLPSDTARVTSPSTYTLSGVVTEKTASGVRASARAFVNAWIQQESFAIPTGIAMARSPRTIRVVTVCR